MFTAVGGKAAVLKLAFDWTLAGDDEPVPIADRPEVRRMIRGTEPAVLLAEWMAMNAAIAGRLAMLYHVLVVAADTDRQAAALSTRRASVSAEPRRRRPPRRPRRPAGGPRRDRATAIAELLIDPEPFRRLVLRHGWTADEYTEHIQQMAAAALLP